MRKVVHRRRSSLVEVGALFFLMGVFGFGGPAAHLAMFEQELVKRRRWITREEMLELIGATNLIPGPNSTEVAFAIGLKRGGFPGMIVAGIAFMAPAVFLTMALAALYVRHGSLPQVAPALVGGKAAVLGVLVGMATRMAPIATKTLALTVLGIVALCASVAGVPEVAVLLLAGAASMSLTRPKLVATASAALLAARAWAVAPIAAGAATIVSLGGLFLFFLHVGATIYGGGFVLVSYLQSGLVDRMGWLSQQQLLDAIVAGQITPGPVFSTATFVGYLLAGVPGALVATVAIFLPCFFLVPLLERVLSWSRKHPRVALFLDGINVAAVALMVAVAIKLAPASAPTVATAVVAAAAMVLTLLRVNAGLIVLLSGLAAWLLKLG